MADQVAEMVETARREFGALHVLYNNAGILLAREDGPTADLSESVFDRTVNVNLKNFEDAKNSLRKAISKLPSPAKIVVGKGRELLTNWNA